MSLACSRTPNVVRVVDMPMEDPQPMLAAAGDPHITLFGELPNVPSFEFESRAAIALRQHSFPSEGSDFDPSVSRDGSTMIFASTRHSMHPDLYMKDVDGVAVTQLTSDPSSDVQPTLSPDGHRVAFTSDRNGNWDIWVVNIDGQQPVQVTTTTAHEVHPSWSPDGRNLVFCSMPERGGQWELWVASAEAGAIKKFIGYGLFPEWSPANDTIVFQRARRRGSRWFSLWTLTLVNGEPRMPTEILSSAEHALILPTWSPEGDRVSYCTVESVAGLDGYASGPLQRADVWMVDGDGRGRVRLTDGIGSNYAPVWSNEGRVFFTSNRDNQGREGIWSVIPLRAPMAAQARSDGMPGGRTHAERAGDVQGAKQVETVGYPKDDTDDR
jgi:TolB protein